MERFDHQDALDTSREDRDRTLAAIHRLERAVGSAAPGREAAWRAQVAEELRTLQAALAVEEEESARPDGLLSLIAREHPRRFKSRVRHLRELHDDARDRVATMIERVEQAAEVDVADLRERIARLTRTLHDRRARESDLVYEALELDLGDRPESDR